jgi:2-keto-4-pentenoate hydratase/2-oxohepta-3-ene-1,7-dioic acid hydratase in catechol pathway
MSNLYRLAVIKSEGRRLAVIEFNGRLLPLNAIFGSQFEDLQPVLEQWSDHNSRLNEFVSSQSEKFADGIHSDSAKFLAPIANPGKIICIGANYHDHVAEMPIPMVPTYPYAFAKPVNNTVRGPGDAVAVPKKVKLMDWEAELAIVIGQTCFEVSAENALSVVAGYMNLNDLSARDWIASRPPIGIDWIQHKAFDGFAPMGPYLVPGQFISDPQDVSVKLSVNGVTKQDSNTAQMIFGVVPIIEHLTSIMTLYPGDVIATGTPAGVGHAKGEYLTAGDVVAMEVGPCGQLVTQIV